jgi:hypothetical protein
VPNEEADLIFQKQRLRWTTHKPIRGKNSLANHEWP